LGWFNHQLFDQSFLQLSGAGAGWLDAPFQHSSFHEGTVFGNLKMGVNPKMVVYTQQPWGKSY